MVQIGGCGYQGDVVTLTNSQTNQKNILQQQASHLSNGQKFNGAIEINSSKLSSVADSNHQAGHLKDVHGGNHSSELGPNLTTDGKENNAVVDKQSDEGFETDSTASDQHYSEPSTTREDETEPSYEDYGSRPSSCHNKDYDYATLNHGRQAEGEDNLVSPVISQAMEFDVAGVIMPKKQAPQLSGQAQANFGPCFVTAKKSLPHEATTQVQYSTSTGSDGSDYGDDEQEALDLSRPTSATANESTYTLSTIGMVGFENMHWSDSTLGDRANMATLKSVSTFYDPVADVGKSIDVFDKLEMLGGPTTHNQGYGGHESRFVSPSIAVAKPQADHGVSSSVLREQGIVVDTDGPIAAKNVTVVASAENPTLSSSNLTDFETILGEWSSNVEGCGGQEMQLDAGYALDGIWEDSGDVSGSSAPKVVYISKTTAPSVINTDINCEDDSANEDEVEDENEINLEVGGSIVLKKIDTVSVELSSLEQENPKGYSGRHSPTEVKKKLDEAKSKLVAGKERGTLDKKTMNTLTCKMYRMRKRQALYGAEKELEELRNQNQMLKAVLKKKQRKVARLKSLYMKLIQNGTVSCKETVVNLLPTLLETL